MQEPVHPGQELHEDAELGGSNGPPVDHLALAQPPGHGRPRVALEGLQAQRDPSLLLIDPQHLHGHRLAHAQPIGRPAHARMGELGQGHEALHAAQVDERAEVRQ